MSADLPILSIRQPWAWAILHAGKDIENRSWSTRVRGRVLIHAGLKYSLEDYDTVEGIMRETGMWVHDLDRALLDKSFDLGGIVGSVEIVDCIDERNFRARSPWFFGPYGFVLRNPIVLPFERMPGKLGFFHRGGEALEARKQPKSQMSFL